MLNRGACIVAVVAGFAVGPSSAAADWGEPFALSQSAENRSAGEGPVVASAPDDSFVAAWFLPVASTDGLNVVQARRIGPTGEPGPVLTLSPDVGDNHLVRVAVGPTGDAVVYWHRFTDDQNDTFLEARRIAADGSLGPHLVLSADGDRAGISSAAVDSAGEATVVWGAHPADSGFKLRTRRVPPSGPPGPTVTVPNDDESFLNDVAVAVGPDRRPLVVISQLGIVKALRLSESGDPLPGITRLSPDGEISEPVGLAMDGSGVARVTWGRSRDPGQISTRTVAPDGTLGATHVLTDQESVFHALAVNEAGSAAIVWQQMPTDEDPRNSVVGVVTRPDGSLGPRRMLSPPSSLQFQMKPDVAIDASGIATVVWQGFLGKTSIVQAVRFSADGAVGKVATLTESAPTVPVPQVAVSPEGIALATWLQAAPDAETFRNKAARFLPPPIPPGPTPPPTYECHGERATIVGTAHDDEIVGTNERDVIDGGPGDDRIKGLGGDDLICGRGGDDDVRGSKGDDAVYAGDGDDRAAGGAGVDGLRGQADDDELVGGVKADTLTAGAGEDLSRGGGGRDRMHGRAGRDRALGGSGRDRISGDEGEDDLTGGGANDRILGGPQDDFLDGNRGVNRCRGGGGVNILMRCQR